MGISQVYGVCAFWYLPQTGIFHYTDEWLCMQCFKSTGYFLSVFFDKDDANISLNKLGLNILTDHL